MSKLHEKLARVQSKLKSIPENGFNAFHKYNYSTASDIIETVRPACAEEGLTVSLSIDSCEMSQGGKAALVWASVTVTDSETGESATAKAPGYSEDSKSDKSCFKAITGASKYAIRSFFCLASGDDPELDAATPAQQPRPQPGKVEASASEQRIAMENFVRETGMSKLQFRDEARKILGRQDIERAEDLSIPEINALISTIRSYH